MFKPTLTAFVTAALLQSLPLNAEQDSDTNGQGVKQGQQNVIEVGDLMFQECLVSAQGRERKVSCAHHQVPENPNLQDGAMIELFIVRLGAKRQSKVLGDPMLFLAGGPGQAASEAFLFSDYQYNKLIRTRDFYLIDQRGTGRSSRLSCPKSLAKYDALYTETDTEQVKRFTRACLQELPGDPKHYTTENTVLDLESVRQALGVKQWNLLGVSYGTRVATHYMRRFPERVRTAVLDSVIPPTLAIGPAIGANSQAALDAMIARCEADPACHEAMPSLAAEVNELIDRLKDSPVDINYEDFSTGQIKSMRLTHQHLNLVLRMFLYQPSNTAILPPIIHEAAVNQYYAPLARITQRWADLLQDSLSIGLHNSVMCTEEVPFFEPVKAKGYLGNSVAEAMTSVCEVWPKGELANDMKEPLNSAIPTLLFSGQYDPITPPKYGDQTAKKLNNAKHFVLDGQGHSVSGTGCAPFLIHQFIDNASLDGLNNECLQRIHAAPLFINFNGTAP